MQPNKYEEMENESGNESALCKHNMSTTLQILNRCCVALEQDCTRGDMTVFNGVSGGV